MNWLRGRLRRTRHDPDGGAVLVEFALTLPLIVLLMLGLLEFGFAWRQVALIDRAAASASRTASSMGDSPWTDYEALRAVDAAMASTTAVEIEQVVIYDAAVNNGRVPVECTGGSSVSGVCNVYSATQVANESLVGFPRGSIENPTCVGGSWDAAWCPMDRRKARPNPDAVGVHIQARYTSLTTLIPGSELDLAYSAAFLLEPPAVGD